MFPGIDGFHWTFGHILFLSLFFVVVMTIATTVISAIWRTTQDFRTSMPLISAGTPTSPICRKPTGAAATNWREE